uniref:hypothetical protein n=1 Tax=Serratia proteamaculans TaxID=28151 RepID=UPI001F4C476B|nr:hypothetical protein [Serratia proteamaculans]ULG18510.1 hypothetical protein Man4p2_00040 [Serratia proteamaculans]
MPLAQYEEIVESVKKDWRTRVAAVFSYVGFVWKFIIRLWSYFVQCFSVLFALFMLYALSHPAEITQFIDEIRSLPSEIIANGIRSLTNICILMTIMGYALSFFLKGMPVFVSATENAIIKKNPAGNGSSAEGQVSVTFKKDGVYCVR